MAAKPIRAYAGSDPYAFICYAHSDADTVYGELAELAASDIPIWYDEGIEPSSLWSDSLAYAIERSSLFICYLSPQSARSEHCRREISFALDLGLKMLITVIEPTELSAGLKLMLGNRQAILRHEMAADVYREKLHVSINDALTEAAQQVSTPVPAPTQQMTSDRRLLTVLCADVVNAENSAWPDPEDWAECVGAFQSLCGRLAGGYEARVAQHSADGVIAYFGHPVAHENDAERAVRCAMELKSAFAEVVAGLDIDDAIQPQLRVAVNSGPVVIDSGTSLTSGPTPNLAVRMQELGHLDTVLISNTTRTLVRRRFDTESLGEQHLSGFGEPVAVYTVVRQLSGPNIRVSQDSPFVGRQMELAQLSALLDRARRGTAMFGLVLGEAGIGKSRLVDEFSKSLDKLSHQWLSMQCSPFDTNSPFAPIVASLAETLGLDDATNAEERAQAFMVGVQRWGIEEADQIAVLADLIGVKIDSEAVLPETAAVQRRLIITALRRALVNPATLTVLHVEDVHWLDPSSQEVIDGLVAESANDALLMLLTARPTFQSPAKWRGRVMTLNVERLLETDVRELIEALAPGAASSTLVERSDGIPLFAEALAKSGELSSSPVPPTLQELLYQQLDQLGEARATAQVASVFGREFEMSRLREVLGLDYLSLEKHMATLVDSGLVFPGVGDGRGSYVFKHALVQEMAYDSILKKARRDVHLQIAELLADKYAESTGSHVLALHFSKARQNARAAALWLEAGRKAFKRSAHSEATSYLRRGLKEIDGIDDPVERDEQEITLQTYLGESLSAMEGYGSQSTQQAFERARELSVVRNRTEATFRAISRLQAVALIQSHIDHAFALSYELQALAKSIDKPKTTADANTMLGITAYRAGDFSQAASCFEEAIAYHRIEHETGKFGSVAAHADAYHSNTLWLLGKPDRALAQAGAALARARSQQHAFNEAAVLTCMGATHIFRGETEHTLQVAGELEVLAEQHNFLVHAHNARCLRGMALIGAGQLDDGIATLYEGIEAFNTMGQGTYATFYQSFLADGYLRNGDLELADAVIQATLEHDAEVGVHISTAELNRLQAELLSLRGDNAQALALLAQAQGMSDRQQTLGAGLRIAMTRCRIEPDSNAAREDLRTRFDRFDEGLDTRDLQEALLLLA
ncbi:MAG: AAA family ATPase [Halioglobus sp.]